MNAAVALPDVPPAGIRTPTDWKGEAMRRRIARRYAAERRFRLLGFASVLLSAGFLAFLLISMLSSVLDMAGSSEASWKRGHNRPSRSHCAEHL